MLLHLVDSHIVQSAIRLGEHFCLDKSPGDICHFHSALLLAGPSLGSRGCVQVVFGLSLLLRQVHESFGRVSARTVATVVAALVRTLVEADLDLWDGQGVGALSRLWGRNGGFLADFTEPAEERRDV